MNETIGRYAVVGRLAMGGMAEILLGRLLGPSGFERPVVIKRILPHLAEQAAFVEMFLDEARLAARIQHRNVVQVHELGREGPNLFLVMEYLEGENAAGLVRRSLVTRSDLDYRLCAFIVAEAAAGLHAAHELRDPHGRPLNLVHRDVSPQNIFITYNGNVKVLDFGIAKAADRTTHTEVGQLKGKFEYMSPEQCRGKPIDRRSDVFALGIVLYELLTRRRLFKRTSKLAVLEAVCREPLVPLSRLVPGIPPVLEHVVMRALARNADERYATAAEMRRELLEALRAMGAPVEPEEALSYLMRALFQDRMAVKHEMLHRVRTGTELAYVPDAEVDDTVEIPDIEQVISGARSKFESGFAATGTDAYALEKRRARGRALKWLLFAMFSIAATGVALIWWNLPRSNGIEMRTGASSLLVPESVYAQPRVIAPTPPPPPPEPAEVLVKIECTPDEASVLIAGEERGKTPIELKITRGTSPIEITLRHEGYQDSVEKIIPDVNQRLQFSLLPAKAKPAAGGAKTKVFKQPPPAGSSGGGFHRFD